MKNKRVLIFNGNKLATYEIFTSYGEAKKYVEKNSTIENPLSIIRLTNRAILRKIRNEMIGDEDAKSSILRLLDIVIADTTN